MRRMEYFTMKSFLFIHIHYCPTTVPLMSSHIYRKKTSHWCIILPFALHIRLETLFWKSLITHPSIDSFMYVPSNAHMLLCCTLRIIHTYGHQCKGTCLSYGVRCGSFFVLVSGKLSVFYPVCLSYTIQYWLCKIQGPGENGIGIICRDYMEESDLFIYLLTKHWKIVSDIQAQKCYFSRKCLFK